MDSLRDLVWKNLQEKEVQLKYESALPDAFPMPKAEYLFPTFDEETWNQLVESFRVALEVLKGQAIKEIQTPKQEPSSWYRKSSSLWSNF